MDIFRGREKTLGRRRCLVIKRLAGLDCAAGSGVAQIRGILPFARGGFLGNHIGLRERIGMCHGTPWGHWKRFNVARRSLLQSGVIRHLHIAHRRTRRCAGGGCCAPVDRLPAFHPLHYISCHVRPARRRCAGRWRNGKFTLIVIVAGAAFLGIQIRGEPQGKARRAWRGAAQGG